MTIIELNIAGYRVTHRGPDLREFTANWFHGWRNRHRKARGRERAVGLPAA